MFQESNGQISNNMKAGCIEFANEPVNGNGNLFLSQMSCGSCGMRRDQVRAKSKASSFFLSQCCDDLNTCPPIFRPCTKVPIALILKHMTKYLSTKMTVFLSVEVTNVVLLQVGSSLIHGMMARRVACEKAKKCGLDATTYMWCWMIVRISVALTVVQPQTSTL